MDSHDDLLQSVAQSVVNDISAPTSKLSEPSLLSLTADNNSNHLTTMDKNNINNGEIYNPVQHHMSSTQRNHEAPSVPTLDNTTNNMNRSNPSQEMKGISPTPSALNMPPLPSFFESSTDLNTMKKSNTKPSLNNLSSVSLFSSASEVADAVSSSDLLNLEQFDEQAFVTALLDQDSNNNLLNHQ